jgi:hypothetical protein
MKRILRLFVAFAFFGISIGCASIVGTTGQSVSVETRDKEKVISGASCEFANSKGKWFVNSPGTVQIRRSNDDLIVLCTKTGIEPGRASVVSDTKGSMFGNILFGGGIGAIVDHNTGAAYEYPTLIQIMMGTEVKIQTNPEDSTKIQTTQVLPAPALPPSAPPVERIVVVDSISQKVITDSTTAPTKITSASPQSDGAKRLTELKLLLDQGLINKQDYEIKKNQILKDM